MQWSRFKKNYLLLIITLAAIVPDFDSGIGTSKLMYCHARGYLNVLFV
jgi:hypothetical protein